MEKKLKMIGFMILGNAILAMGTAAFVVPNGLISGGVTGIGLILQRLFGLPVDIGVFVADGVLFLLGAAVMGKAFAATIILSTIVYPTFFSLFGKIPFLTSLTDAKLMAAIYAGLLMGAHPVGVHLKGLLLLAALVAVSAVGFSFYNQLLRYHPVGQIAIYNAFIPVLGVVLSCLLLGEPFSWRYLLSGALVTVGICAVNLPGKGKN